MNPLLLFVLSLAPQSAHAPLPAALAVLEEPVEITLTKLMSFEWKQGQEVPKEIRELDGKQVKITGLMALGTLEGVTEFELVSDSCGCGQSKMNHFVRVELEDDTTGYTPNEVTVTGTFEVGEEVEDGFVVSLFRLKAKTLEQ